VFGDHGQYLDPGHIENWITPNRDNVRNVS